MSDYTAEERRAGQSLLKAHGAVPANPPGAVDGWWATYARTLIAAGWTPPPHVPTQREQDEALIRRLGGRSPGEWSDDETYEIWLVAKRALAGYPEE